MLLSYSTGSYVDYNLANKVSTTGDASISGHLDVSKVLNLQRHPTESDTIPLVITNTGSSGAGFVGKCVSTVTGCLFEHLTSASSTSRWQGILSGSNAFVIKTGSNGLTLKPTGDVSISSNFDVGSVTIDAGNNKMGKLSVGDTTAYESLNGNVDGFNLNPQTQMSFVACATKADSTVNHIGLCCLNRASTYSSYTPAITCSAWGHYYGAELNHIGAIACQQKQIQGQRHLEGDMVFSPKIQLMLLERHLGFMVIKLQGPYPI